MILFSTSRSFLCPFLSARAFLAAFFPYLTASLMSSDSMAIIIHTRLHFYIAVLCTHCFIIGDVYTFLIAYISSEFFSGKQFHACGNIFAYIWSYARRITKYLYHFMEHFDRQTPRGLKNTKVFLYIIVYSFHNGDL